MISIFDDHKWWSYMAFRYDDHMWRAYMIIICDEHIWWTYMMIIYDGDHIWRSHSCDHHMWRWSRMINAYEDHQPKRSKLISRLIFNSFHELLRQIRCNCDPESILRVWHRSEGACGERAGSFPHHRGRTTGGGKRVRSHLGSRTTFLLKDSKLCPHGGRWIFLLST